MADATWPVYRHQGALYHWQAVAGYCLIAPLRKRQKKTLKWHSVTKARCSEVGGAKRERPGEVGGVRKRGWWGRGLLATVSAPKET